MFKVRFEKYQRLTRTAWFFCTIFVFAVDVVGACGAAIAEDSVENLPNIERPDEYSEYRSLGIGWGASKAYRKENEISINGYVDLVYEKFSRENNLGEPSNLNQQMGVARAVIFTGYRYSDRLVLNSEIRWARELEDSRTARFTVDLAHLDYFLHDDLVFRAGVILIPMGLVNEFHGPNEFLGTRPALGDIETIPSTWHAAGVGFAGRKWIGDFRVYIVSGLNAAGFSIRGSRNAREISMDTLKRPALVVRLDGHLFRGGMLGGSYYVGDSGVFGAPQETDLKIHTVVQEIHWETIAAGWQIRAQYAKILLDNSRELNIVLGVQGLAGIGSRMVGGYVEAGYDFWANRRNGTRLMPYIRVEETNPQDALPPSSIALGLRKNLTVDHFVYTYGLEFRPVERVIIKADYQRVHAEKVDVGVNQFNVALSCLF